MLVANPIPAVSSVALSGEAEVVEVDQSEIAVAPETLN